MDVLPILYAALGVPGFLSLVASLAFRESLERRHAWFFKLSSTASQVLPLASLILLCTYPNQPRIPLPREVRLALGALLLASGFSLELKGTLDMGLERSMGGVCGSQLVKRGIYGVIRHPQNLGAMIWPLGAAALADSGYLLLVSLLIWTPLILLESYMEDVDLRRTFGREFEEYAREVPMFIPRLRR